MHAFPVWSDHDWYIVERAEPGLSMEELLPQAVFAGPHGLLLPHAGPCQCRSVLSGGPKLLYVVAGPRRVQVCDLLVLGCGAGVRESRHAGLYDAFFLPPPELDQH